MKALKIFGKFLLVIVILLLIAMLVIPYFYKDRIAELVKTEINKQIKAEVNFSDADLSLFRNFPNFSLGINNLSVVNPPSDTLLTVNGLYVKVGLLSVFNNDAIEIKSILIDGPDLSLIVNEQGKENWDIMKGSEGEPESVGKSGKEEMKLLLNKIKISSGEITYRDNESKILAVLKNFNGLLKGRFTESRTNLKLKLNSDAVSVVYDGIAYLDNTVMEFDAVIDANLDDEIYNLKNNSLYLNGLRLNFEGSAAYVNDDLSLMLVYKAPDNSFKELLSLVPSVYQEDFDKLSASGQFELDGFIKGIYSEEKIPDFKLQAKVKGAEISYEGMPASLKNIGFSLLVDSKGNDLNNMRVKLDNFTGMIGKDNIHLNLFLTHLMTDPYIDTKVSGDFHLENLKQVFPQESLQSLTGELIADFTVKGNISASEQHNYDQILAMGSLICKDVKYDYEAGYPVIVNHAQLNFSPAQIDIIGFSGSVNGNQLMADGKMKNYLNYFLKDGLFAGNLNMKSDKLDLNTMLEPWSSDETENIRDGKKERGETVTYIPKNIDVMVSLKADTVLYQKLSFTDFNSGVHIHDGKVDFEKFNSNFLGGLIDLEGYYEATPEVTPHLDFNLSLKEMNISKAYQNLVVFRQFAPVAEKAEGVFNSTLSLSTDLDGQMNPIWTSMLGSGKLTSDHIELNAQDIIQKISDVIKVKLFQNPSTGPVDLKFKMLNGKLYNSPFHVNVNGADVEVGGWTGFDQQIDYTLGFNIPVKLLGTEVADVINHYASEASKFGVNLGNVQTLKPVVEVTGKFKDPKVKLVSMGKSAGNGVKDVVKDKVEEVVDEYAKKASEEAKKILSNAQRQADSIVNVAKAKADQIMKTASQSIDRIKADAQMQADQLVKEAAKQGAIAELAARKTADELLKSANAQADGVLQKAQQESDKLVTDARLQSEKIMQQANEKADRIRK